VKPRRTLPTIREHWPLWRRAAHALVARIVVAWAQERRLYALQEERGYRQVGRINGVPIGEAYRRNMREHRRQLRALALEWSR
jgi:hypothetical protein